MKNVNSLPKDLLTQEIGSKELHNNVGDTLKNETTKEIEFQCPNVNDICIGKKIFQNDKVCIVKDDVNLYELEEKNNTFISKPYYLPLTKTFNNGKKYTCNGLIINRNNENFTVYYKYKAKDKTSKEYKEYVMVIVEKKSRFVPYEIEIQNKNFFFVRLVTERKSETLYEYKNNNESYLIILTKKSEIFSVFPKEFRFKIKGEQLTEFTFVQLLGIGGIGTVFEYKDSDDKQYAIKFPHKPLESNASIIKKYDFNYHQGNILVADKSKCIEILSCLGDKNLYSEESSTLISEMKALSFTQRIHYIAQLVHDLARFHNNTGRFSLVTYHGDIKPQNIVHDSKNGLSFIDYDMAKNFLHAANKLMIVKSLGGTPLFVGLETIKNSSVRIKKSKIFGVTGDINALGVVFLYLAGVENPMCNKNLNLKAPYSIEKLLNVTIISDCPETYKVQIKSYMTALIKRMIGDWQQRPSVNDLNRFFTDLLQVLRLAKGDQQTTEIKTEITQMLKRCEEISKNCYFAEAENINFFVATKPVEEKDFYRKNSFNKKKLKKNILTSLKTRNTLNDKKTEETELKKFAELYAQALDFYNQIVLSPEENNKNAQYGLLKLIVSNSSDFKEMLEFAPELKRPINIWFNLSLSNQKIKENNKILKIKNAILETPSKKKFTDQMLKDLKEIIDIQEILKITIEEENILNERKHDVKENEEDKADFLSSFEKFFSKDEKNKSQQALKELFSNLDHNNSSTSRYITEPALWYYKTIYTELTDFIQKKTETNEKKKKLFKLLKEHQASFQFLKEKAPSMKPEIEKAELLAVKYFKEEYEQSCNNRYAFFKSEMYQKVYNSSKNSTLSFQDILEHKGWRTQKIISAGL